MMWTVLNSNKIPCSIYCLLDVIEDNVAASGAIATENNIPIEVDTTLIAGTINGSAIGMLPDGS